MYYSPDNKIRSIFFQIIHNKLFDAFIMLCIIANIVTMSMAYEGNSLILLVFLGSPATYDSILK